jgi:hypothetical protein
MYNKQRKGQVVVCPKIKLPTCAFKVDLINTLFDTDGKTMPDRYVRDEFMNVTVSGYDKDHKAAEEWVWMSAFRVFRSQVLEKKPKVQIAKVALWKGVKQWFYSNLSFESMLGRSGSALKFIKDTLGQFLVADALLCAEKVVIPELVTIELDSMSLGVLLGFIVGPLQMRLQPIKNTYVDLITQGLDRDLSDQLDEALTDISLALGYLIGDMEGSDGSFNNRANFLPSYIPVSRER